MYSELGMIRALNSGESSICRNIVWARDVPNIPYEAPVIITGLSAKG